MEVRRYFLLSCPVGSWQMAIVINIQTLELLKAILSIFPLINGISTTAKKTSWCSFSACAAGKRPRRAAIWTRCRLRALYSHNNDCQWRNVWSGNLKIVIRDNPVQRCGPVRCKRAEQEQARCFLFPLSTNFSSFCLHPETVCSAPLHSIRRFLRSMRGCSFVCFSAEKVKMMVYLKIGLILFCLITQENSF